MPIQKLKVSQFRNLSHVDMEPSPVLNFLYGENGSGKTSLLESISLLAHGRSFRTRKFRRLVQHDTAGLTVYGQLLSDDGLSVDVGVQRPITGNSEYRIDGVGVRSSAQLAEQMPLLVLNGDSFGLLVGPPKQRRQFFDWLVFHVKPDFRSAWRQFTRCVKQRNSLLRRDKISSQEIHPWDVEIARLSEAIEKARVESIAPFLDCFSALTAGMAGPVKALEIQYQSGWRGEGTYQQQLAEAFPRDRRVGYTTLGPHKSDIKITINGIPAGEILSRGQQKSTIAAMYVAEARTFSEALDRSSVFLIDDMPAELDQENISRVGMWLNQTRAQVFVTSVEFSPLEGAWPDLANKDHKVFHVKQGKIVGQVGLQ